MGGPKPGMAPMIRPTTIPANIAAILVNVRTFKRYSKLSMDHFPHAERLYGETPAPLEQDAFRQKRAESNGEKCI